MTMPLDHCRKSLPSPLRQIRRKFHWFRGIDKTTGADVANSGQQALQTMKMEKVSVSLEKNTLTLSPCAGR